MVLPIFGFANAGVSFVGVGLATLTQPVPLGIALGLFVGKQIGVFAGIALVVRAMRCPLPEGATWAQVYGVAVLTGVGFTMSLFIGGLAFPDGSRDDVLRIGVMVGSLASALTGAAIIALGARTIVPGADTSMHEFLEYRDGD